MGGEFPAEGRSKTANSPVWSGKTARLYGTLIEPGCGAPARIQAAACRKHAIGSPPAAALLAALGLPGASATHAAAPAGGTFFVSGHGWGHGVGLAQYGAYGYALHGWTYDQIVAHYYPGTELGDAPVNRARVLLAGAAKSLAISSRSPFTVRDGAGKAHRLPAGKQQLGPGLKLKLPSSTKALPGPLILSPGPAAVALGGRSYRGTFRVTGGKAVRVVNTRGVEAHRWGGV